MEKMNVVKRLLGNPWVYRLWQAPFADRKLAPLFEHNQVTAARRVLDVGCGPGTSARHFESAYYLGLDINPEYIEFARARYQRDFQVADITTYEVRTTERFDLILINSFLHHVDAAAARRILKQAGSLLTDDGHIHVFDLVLPEEPSVARFLARKDRGEHPRPLEVWRQILSECFEPELFRPYPLEFLGVTLWNMVYFRGRTKR
jgi:SAM-dependent methyltransferase